MKMIFETQIDTAIEGLFKEVAADYNLTSGDIDPTDSFALDTVKERLNSILAGYVLGNMTNDKDRSELIIRTNS